MARHFTNADKPVFAIFNLPEIVKGALFARYSRSGKSLRRLFLDEFYKPYAQSEAETDAAVEEPPAATGEARAQSLYERVFIEYGDDSVAQLGAAHLACERASNVLTKILERGRMASYLEQSTRYIHYGEKENGAYRYVAPPEVQSDALLGDYRAFMDGLFETYNRVLESCFAYFKRKYPYSEKTHRSPRAWEASVRAQAYDVARGILPAGAYSNVGVFASGQALERLILRLMASPLAEARQCADMALNELRKVAPDFLKRVDVPDRGLAWVDYLRKRQETSHALADEFAPIPAPDDFAPSDQPAVELVDWDEAGEAKVVASILYENSGAAFSEIQKQVKRLNAAAKSAIIRRYCQNRQNRRHLPGRALESADYQFDILSDYGSFRDLQRHRLMTIEWQPLSARRGYLMPALLNNQTSLADAKNQWRAAMERSAVFYNQLRIQIGELPAQYVVPFAYNIRYTIRLNARQAFHLIELRSGKQAHENYRRVALKMHALIRDKAGHRDIAESMNFVALAGRDGLIRLGGEQLNLLKRARQLNLPS